MQLIKSSLWMKLARQTVARVIGACGYCCVQGGFCVLFKLESALKNTGLLCRFNFSGTLRLARSKGPNVGQFRFPTQMVSLLSQNVVSRLYADTSFCSRFFSWCDFFFSQFAKLLCNLDFWKALQHPCSHFVDGESEANGKVTCPDMRENPDGEEESYNHTAVGCYN